MKSPSPKGGGSYISCLGTASRGGGSYIGVVSSVPLAIGSTGHRFRGFRFFQIPGLSGSATGAAGGAFGLHRRGQAICLNFK